MFQFLKNGVHDKAFKLILKTSEKLTNELCPWVSTKPEPEEYFIESLILFYSCALKIFAANKVQNEVGLKLYHLIQNRFSDKTKTKLKQQGFEDVDVFIQERSHFYFLQINALQKYEPIYMDANPQSPVIEMCYLLASRPLTKEMASVIISSGRPKAVIQVNLYALAHLTLPFYKTMNKLLPQFYNDIESIL